MRVPRDVSAKISNNPSKFIWYCRIRGFIKQIKLLFNMFSFVLHISLNLSLVQTDWVKMYCRVFVYSSSLSLMYILTTQCAAFACLGHHWTDFIAHCNKTTYICQNNEILCYITSCDSQRILRKIAMCKIVICCVTHSACGIMVAPVFLSYVFVFVFLFVFVFVLV